MKSEQKSHTIILGFILALFLLGGFGCSSDPGTETGQVSFGLTDGAGEFTSYNVGVSSITLTREDGTKVQVLPENVQVDFAQYENMTELVVTTDVPVGVYTGVIMTLDYTDVDVTVENSQGKIVNVDVLVDKNGTSVGQVSVNVDVADILSIEVNHGIHTYVSVDFDLEESHSLTFDSEQGVLAIVTPHININVDYNDFKPLRVRGTLGDVLPDEGEFYVNLKPFYLSFNQAYDGFGEIMVSSQETTAYTINGKTYVGSEGLDALADIDPDTPVIARGQMAFEPFRLLADTVYAGTSIPGMDSDYVTGIVKSLEGSTVEISGLVYNHTSRRSFYSSDVQVTVSGNTAVTNMAGGTYALDDLSTGQHVMVSGDLTDTDIGTAMDATQGSLWLYDFFNN